MLRYDKLFATENWQKSCQLNLVHKFKKKLQMFSTKMTREQLK